MSNPVASWGRTPLSWGGYCITGACRKTEKASPETPGIRINRSLQTTPRKSTGNLSELIKWEGAGAHRWGTAAGGLFSDTSQQGAGQASPSPPNNRTLNSSRRNAPRRKKVGSYQR